ncbi:hypothetical protein H8E77_42255 [bacterium]|nr:hypothetical protein [bacterium]
MGKQLQNQKFVSAENIEGEKMSNIADRCDLYGGELKPGKTTLGVWRGE